MRARLHALRRWFWLPPAAAMAAAIVLAYAMPALDRLLGVDVPLFTFADYDSARRLLQTIATVTVSVIGIAFSVTVVALQLASQQLSPRVLRTFQGDQLNQGVLAVFLGAFVYALVLLTQLETGEGLPQLALALAVIAAVAAFGLFVAFIAHVVDSLQASTVIARIAGDGHAAIADRHPSGIGAAPADAAAAARQAEERMRAPGTVVHAEHGGYVTRVDADALMEALAHAEGFAAQRMELGTYVLRGQPLAEVWAPRATDALASAVRDTFVLGKERTLPADVAFPVRQLADIALRTLSPSQNDPTTAENAMSALTDVLAGVARAHDVAGLRVDDAGVPRFLACGPQLDDLVRLGFEQVRRTAATDPAIAARLARLLEALRGEAERRGRPTEAIQAQEDAVRALLPEERPALSAGAPP